MQVIYICTQVTQLDTRQKSLLFCCQQRIAVLNSSTSEHQPAGVPFLSQLFAIVSSVRMGGVSKALMGLAAVAVGMALLCNLPDNPFVPAPKPASLDYLAETTLSTMDKKPRKFKANELWENTGAVIMAVRRPGCSLCREEALELSRIRPELKLRNVPLYAVVHETLGVEEFAPFLEADGIYLDTERQFYGPQERWMLISGFLRASVWSNIVRNWKKGVEGNMEGEGRLLGGVFVLGPGRQGILYEYREKEFGDLANTTDILAAVRKMRAATS